MSCFSMLNLEFEKIIRDFSTYFGIALKNISFSFNNKIPIAHANREKSVLNGLRNIISQVSKSNNPEFNAIEDQWVEYTLTHLGNLDSPVATQVLKELNEYMVDKVYFVGNQLGPVDILMYYLLYSIMLNLSFQEKEKYLHASRWFNNIQQNKNARLWRSVIPFSRSRLYV